MNDTLLIAICSFVLVIYAISFIHYKKNRDNLRTNEGRMHQLPLLYLFLIGPLYFFMINRTQRRERRNFMEGKRRFS